MSRTRTGKADTELRLDANRWPSAEVRDVWRLRRALEYSRYILTQVLMISGIRPAAPPAA